MLPSNLFSRAIQTAGLLFAAGFLSLPVFSGGEPTAGAATIVAFGDSTTAPRKGLVPYAERLQQRLADAGAAVTVVNAGVRGDTTVRARERFVRDVLARQPRLVIVQFGLNDAAIDVWKAPPATEPRVSLADYEANLDWFVTEARRHGADAVLMTPNAMRWTPLLRERYGRPPYCPDDEDGLNVELRRYADAVRRVASARNVSLADILNAHDEVKRTTGEPLLLDGMHPNQAGQDLVARELLTLLRTRPEWLGAPPGTAVASSASRRP